MHPSLRSALTDTVVAQRHADADWERLARLAVGRPASTRNVVSRLRRDFTKARGRFFANLASSGIADNPINRRRRAPKLARSTGVRPSWPSDTGDRPCSHDLRSRHNASLRLDPLFRCSLRHGGGTR